MEPFSVKDKGGIWVKGQEKEDILTDRQKIISEIAFI